VPSRRGSEASKGRYGGTEKKLKNSGHRREISRQTISPRVQDGPRMLAGVKGRKSRRNCWKRQGKKNLQDAFTVLGSEARKLLKREWGQKKNVTT